VSPVLNPATPVDKKKLKYLSQLPIGGSGAKKTDAPNSSPLLFIEKGDRIGRLFLIDAAAGKQVSIP
jgi:hypothetical protein